MSIASAPRLSQLSDGAPKKKNSASPKCERAAASRSHPRELFVSLIFSLFSVRESMGQIRHPPHLKQSGKQDKKEFALDKQPQPCVVLKQKAPRSRCGAGGEEQIRPINGTESESLAGAWTRATGGAPAPFNAQVCTSYMHTYINLLTHTHKYWKQGQCGKMGAESS